MTIVLGLLGGLALFLYGMQMMSSGLEAAAGNRMKQLLEKLTGNRFLGVIVGAGITAVIQSSSATTVMVVGFVNSGLMTLRQAVWIIMGANVGTTITAQLITLDIGLLAPGFAFLGVAAVMFFKKPSFQHYGNIIAGFGILFIGVDMMSGAMLPLRESEAFVGLMTRFSNPVLGILVGALFTAVIQSSSASVGILQALAISGVIGLPSAVYVLFGQNIGTCITAVLAAIGTSRVAKRATAVHMMFNVIGTLVFTIICIMTPLTAFMEGLFPGDPSAQIANMHTLFNVVTTLLLLPFGTLLARLAERLLPDVPEEEGDGFRLEFIKPVEKGAEYHLGNSAIILSGVRREILRMMDMTRENVSESFLAVQDGDSRRLAAVTATEDYIDYLNKEIAKYISGVIAYENNAENSRVISAYFKISGNLERIGDHAINICEYTQHFGEKGIQFSEVALQEIREMREVCLSAIDLLYGLHDNADDCLVRISAMEQKMDDMRDMYRENQIQRMRESKCSGDAGIIYSEMLTDFERIGDHILNIAEAYVVAQR